MLRSFAAFAVVAVFGLGAAQADTYADPNGRFKVTVPGGWTVVQRPAEGIDVGLISPRVEETNGKCPAIAMENPSSRDMSQEDINQALSEGANEEFWKRAFAGAGLSQMTIEKADSEMKDGRRVLISVARFPVSMPSTGQTEGRMKIALHAIPGRLLMLACAAFVSGWAVEEPDITIIFDSFTPKADLIARADGQAPAALVLYSGPRFDGAERALAQDAPNLALLGWGGPTASLRVAGAGLWQVCDRINYVGHCFVASLPIAGAIGDRPLQVASARRYAGPRDRGAVLGLIGSGAAEQARAAMQVLTRRGR